MIGDEWDMPEPIIPDPPDPADEEDQYDRFLRLEAEAEEWEADDE